MTLLERSLILTTALAVSAGTPQHDEGGVGAALPPAQTGLGAPASAPAAGPEVRTGEIRGQAHLNVRPPRRRASRYSGRTQAARAPQEIPTAVYLREAIPGRSARAPATPEMAQQDTTFSQPLLFVPPGTEVSFPNRDPFFHNVFSYSPGARFDLGRYPQGETKSVVFEEAGEVSIFCEVHESMRALVVVTENPFHTTLAEDGSFVLEGVPAGTYTLVLTHADLGSAEQVVTVRDGEVTEVEITLG